MPSDQAIVRFEDILDNIDRIERYTRDYNFDRFAQDQKCLDAVERCLLRISEAARKLEGTVEPLAPDQPWSQIRAIGNVLRHEYDNVNPAVIWQIVTHDLQPLRKAVQSALQKVRDKN